jgi:hypothetical protein
MHPHEGGMRDILLATIPATIPTMAVLVGILLNQNGINRLDARMNSFDSPMNSFESRIDSLSKQLNEGIVMLMGRDTEKAERLARLEERSKS